MEILPTVVDFPSSGISLILVVVAAECFCFPRKGFRHWLDLCPGLQHLKQRLLSKHLCLSSGVSFSIQMTSTSMVFGSHFFWAWLLLFLLSWKGRNGLLCPLVISLVLSQTCLKWRVCWYHFSMVVGTVSMVEMVSLLEEKQRWNEYVISQARCVCTCRQTKYTTAVTWSQHLIRKPCGSSHNGVDSSHELGGDSSGEEVD